MRKYWGFLQRLFRVGRIIVSLNSQAALWIVAVTYSRVSTVSKTVVHSTKHNSSCASSSQSFTPLSQRAPTSSFTIAFQALLQSKLVGESVASIEAPDEGRLRTRARDVFLQIRGGWGSRIAMAGWVPRAWGDGHGGVWRLGRAGGGWEVMVGVGVGACRRIG